MPRGPQIILSCNTFRELISTIPPHPRIRRHFIAITVISEYRRCNTVDLIEQSKSSTTVPSLFREILKSFESRFLDHPSDLKITPISLWRIHCRDYVPPLTDPIHHAIYFQHRTLSEIEQSTHSIRRLRVPPKCILSTTTILQNRNTILYSAPDLHSTPHGSLHFDHVPIFDSILRCIDVDHTIIRREDSDKSGTVSKKRHHGRISTLQSTRKSQQQIARWSSTITTQPIASSTTESIQNRHQSRGWKN